MNFLRRDDILLAYMLDGELNEIYNTFNSFGEKAKIVEFGSGGSTVAWLYNLKPNQTFISIEHDQEWYKKVQTLTKDHIENTEYLKRNFRYYYIPKNGMTGPDVGQFDFDDACLDYVNGPKEEFIWDSNVYVVDGLARLQCLFNIYDMAQNRDAIVYLHDYGASKPRYQPLFEKYTNYEIFTLPISNDWNGMIKLKLK